MTNTVLTQKNTQKQRNNNNRNKRNTRNRKILPRPGNLTRDLFFHSLMRYHLATDITKRID